MRWVAPNIVRVMHHVRCNRTCITSMYNGTEHKLERVGHIQRHLIVFYLQLCRAEIRIPLEMREQRPVGKNAPMTMKKIDY